MKKLRQGLLLVLLLLSVSVGFSQDIPKTESELTGLPQITIILKSVYAKLTTEIKNLKSSIEISKQQMENLRNEIELLKTDLIKSRDIIELQSRQLKEALDIQNQLSSSLKNSEEQFDILKKQQIWTGIISGGVCLGVGVIIGLIIK